MSPPSSLSQVWLPIASCRLALARQNLLSHGCSSQYAYFVFSAALNMRSAALQSNSSQQMVFGKYLLLPRLCSHTSQVQDYKCEYQFFLPRICFIFTALYRVRFLYHPKSPRMVSIRIKLSLIVS